MFKENTRQILKMKPYIQILLVLVLGVATFAQESPQKKTFVSWEKSEACKICDHIVIEGKAYYVFNDEKVFFAFHGSKEGDYWVGDLYITNHGERFVFDPAMHTGIVAWKTEAEYLAGAAFESFRPTPPETIIKKLERRAAWANALRSFGAALQTRSTSTMTTSSGTATIYNNGQTINGIYTEQSSSTTTQPNAQAQAEAARQNAATNNQVATTGSSMIASALKANTVFPSSTVFGNVYYPLKKKFDVVSFRFVVNDKIYALAFFVGKDKK